MGGKNFAGDFENREHLIAPSGHLVIMRALWDITRTWFMENWEKAADFIPDVE